MCKHALLVCYLHQFLNLKYNSNSRSNRNRCVCLLVFLFVYLFQKEMDVLLTVLDQIRCLTINPWMVPGPIIRYSSFNGVWYGNMISLTQTWKELKLPLFISSLHIFEINPDLIFGKHCCRNMHQQWSIFWFHKGFWIFGRTFFTDMICRQMCEPKLYQWLCEEQLEHK